MNENGFSLADIKAVTDGNNDGFGGGNGAWWLIVLFLFAICGGWNGGGYGGFGGGSGAMDNYVLASDFAQLSRQLDSATASLERKGDAINNGLCDGFYAMNTGLLNGFAGVNANITNAQINAMQNANAMQAQLADCCCQNREAIAGVNYNMAMNTNTLQNAINTGFCQTNYNNATNTRDLLEASNTNTRAILDALNANKVEALKDRIAEQNATINALQLQASQSAQNAYLINELAPKCPIPAYNVPNPYANCGCGCNNF